MNVGEFDQFGTDLADDVARLERVAGPGGVGHVILDDDPSAIVIARQVERGDVDEGVLGNRQSDRVALVMGVVVNDLVGDDAISEDFLGGMDVLEKGVPDADALGDAVGEEVPFLRIDDARKEIDGDDAIMAGVVVIEVKGDAEVPHHLLAAGGEAAEFAGAFVEQGGLDAGVNLRGAIGGVGDFIEGGRAGRGGGGLEMAAFRCVHTARRGAGIGGSCVMEGGTLWGWRNQKDYSWGTCWTSGMMVAGVMAW
jgi:hypothetical protein